MLYFTRRFVLFLTLYYFVLVFVSPFSIAITSLGEERANLSAFRTFVRFALVWSVSSSSWCLGRAAVCDCGTPWTFLLPFSLKKKQHFIKICYNIHNNTHAYGIRINIRDRTKARLIQFFFEEVAPTRFALIFIHVYTKISILLFVRFCAVLQIARIFLKKPFLF